jgi:hypothetical protein
MALSEFEIKRIEKLVGKFVEGQQPVCHIRRQLEYTFRISKQSFEILEVRPQHNDPTKIQEIPIAKATYIKSRKLWKLYWMRADLKWHSYKPFPESSSLEKILEVIAQDRYNCFFG